MRFASVVMSELFHSVIFVFHFATALLITFAIWVRCDPDLWISRMHVDTYHAQYNSSGLWWYDDDVTESDRSLLSLCSALNATDSRTCFAADLPLYERVPSDLGWHLFALLGHFEWISSAFALFYIRHSFNRYSWIFSTAMVLIGTIIFMPYRGKVFINEILIFWANFAVCAGVFYGYRNVHSGYARVAPEAVAETQQPAQVQATEASPSQSMDARFFLSGQGDLVADSLHLVELPALRFCEYSISAAELFVAVLCVYVQDPPAFMTIGGYTLILLTNLYGLLLHYSLISDNVKAVLASRAEVPRQLQMRSRSVLKVPPYMLGLSYEETVRLVLKKQVWGSYIASNSSTLLNSWLAYLVAVSLILYQETFLFGSDAPAFVVFAGWSLIVTFTSFGVWVTFVYWLPSYASRACWFLPDKDVFVIVVYGLDVLSLAAKLSIVGSLSYGFVFRAEGRC